MDNKNNNTINTIIPSKEELKKLVDQYYPTSHREDKNLGTNCKGEMLNYIKNGRNIKLFAKKSFLKMDIAKFEEEYKLLKSKFKNIIPNRRFIKVGNNIFAFCAPISIKVDIFEENSTDYIIKLLKEEPKLLKQLKFFIRIFEELQREGLILDLFGSENLVISDENRLYYLDSFLVFHESSSVIQRSLRNLEFLKELVKRSESEK